MPKPWADGPFELIPPSRLGYKVGNKVKPAHLMAEEMIIVHNVWIRGINSIYLQCVNVEREPTKVVDFAHYALTWGENLEHHHHAEEEMVFPDIERITGVEGLMAPNVEQHHAFEPGMKEYLGYLQAVIDGKEKYDGTKLKGIIDSFMPVLRDHLDDEIVTLKVLDKYEDKTDWAKWYKELTGKIMKRTTDPHIKDKNFPLAIHCHDKTWENGIYASWPPIPWLVLVVLKFLYFGKYKSWWEFGPCDANSNPKDLPFAE